MPKFTTISAPKLSDPNQERKLKSSWVGEFNRIQMGSGKPTISNFSATAWLRDERPKIAICPHQVDYCDFCSKLKKELQAVQQVSWDILGGGHFCQQHPSIWPTLI